MSISLNNKEIPDPEIRFKFLSDSVLKAFEKDGRKYCRLTASSNAEDLVGDVMSQKALEQMKSAAVGTASPFAIFDFGFAIGLSICDFRMPICDWVNIKSRCQNPTSEVGRRNKLATNLTRLYKHIRRSGRGALRPLLPEILQDRTPRILSILESGIGRRPLDFWNEDR